LLSAQVLSERALVRFSRAAAGVHGLRLRGERWFPTNLTDALTKQQRHKALQVKKQHVSSIE